MFPRPSSSAAGAESADRRRPATSQGYNRSPGNSSNLNTSSSGSAVGNTTSSSMIPPVGPRASGKAAGDGDAGEDLHAELKFLQRKVRLLEDAHLTDVRKFQVKESQNRTTIERLRDDNKRLRQDLMARTRASGKPLKEAVTEAERIVELQHQLDKVRRLLDEERASTSEKDAHITRLSDQLVIHQDMVNQMSSDQPLRDDLVAAKKIGTLERRLELMSKSYNEKCAELLVSKRQEQDFGIERQTYEAALQRAQKDILKRDRMVEDLEFRLRQANTARESAQSEVAALTLQFEREKEQWQSEMRELDAKLHANRKITETLLQEDQRKLREANRQSGMLSNRTDSPKHQNSSSLQLASPLSTSSSLVKKSHPRTDKKSGSVSGGSAADQQAAREEREAEFLGRLLTVLGAATNEEAHSRAVSLQDANYSLLKYNAELQEECNHLSKTVEELQKVVGEANQAKLVVPQEENVEQSDQAYLNDSAHLMHHASSSGGSGGSGATNTSGHNQVIKTLEDKLEEERMANTRLSGKYEKLSKLYVEVKAGVEALCNKVSIQIQHADVIQSADQSLHSTVADDRVLTYLQKLEGRILELSRSSDGELDSTHGSSASGQNRRGASLQRTGSQTDINRPVQSRSSSPQQSRSSAMLASLRQSAAHKDSSVISVQNVSKFLNQMVEESDSDDEFTELLDRDRLKQLSLQKIKEKEAEENDERLRKSRFHRTRKGQQ